LEQVSGRHGGPPCPEPAKFAERVLVTHSDSVFGLHETAIIFRYGYGLMLAVTQATKAGFDNVPRILSMQVSNLGRERTARCFLARAAPAKPAVPARWLAAGLGICLAFLVQGEMLYGALGLGQLLIRAATWIDINQVVAVMVLIALLGTC